MTQELYKELMLGFLDSLQSEVPLSMDKAAAMANRREGALSIIEQVHGWEPLALKEGE